MFSIRTDVNSGGLPLFLIVVRIVFYMMNIANTGSSMLNPHQNRIGVLTDTEVLLVDVVQGKQVLRSTYFH